MAFRARNRKAERGEIELLRGLVTLANQLQSSLELDAIVHVIATALSETFGFREAAVYLLEPDGDTFRVHATVGEHPDYDRELFERPVPARIWDELFLAKYQIGSSYFVDHRQHEWTEEQLHYLPPLDLGPRRDGRVAAATTTCFVPLYDKKRELMGVLDLLRPGRPRAADPRARQVARGVRRARRGGHRERAPVRAARGAPRRSSRRSSSCATCCST